MAKVFTQIIRNCSLLKAASRPKSLFLFGKWEKKDSVDDNANNILSEDVLAAHKKFYSDYVDETAAAFEEDELLNIKKRFQDSCYYIGANRELYTSWIMMTAYRMFEEPDKLTKENMKKMSMLAWAFEAISTMALMADDVIDEEPIRWKKPCWHLKPNIGISVLNDVNLLRMSSFYITRKYFHDHPSISFLLSLLNETVYSISIGQTIDIGTSSTFKRNRDINIYTPIRYHLLTVYNAYIPIMRTCTMAAMLLTNTHKEFIKYAYVFEKLGAHVQRANDLYDCFGKYENFGRRSTDLVQGKLSWVVTTALGHANEKQKLLLQNHYARPEPESHQIVLHVFRELELLQKFSKFTTDLVKDVRNDLESVDNPKIVRMIETYVDMYVDVDHDFVD